MNTSVNDPGFTLRTYTHLMPSSETRTRAAGDAVWAASVADNGPETAQESRQVADLWKSQKPKSCVHQGPPSAKDTPTPRVL